MRASIDTFNARLQASETLLFLPRDAEQQQIQLDDLRLLERDAEALKQAAVHEKDEAGANLMLAFQCAADSFAEELAMWLALKECEPDRAWDHLVSAQEANNAMYRLDTPFRGVERRDERLRLLEFLLFPPQVFMSVGCIVHAADCSICGNDYEDCEHIAGRAYWGQFCAMVPRSMEGDHAALVDLPADKRCRARFFSDEGMKRNRMTLASTGETMADHTFEGVLMSASSRWGAIRFEIETFEAPAQHMTGRPITGGWKEVPPDKE